MYGVYNALRKGTAGLSRSFGRAAGTAALASYAARKIMKGAKRKGAPGKYSKKPAMKRYRQVNMYSRDIEHLKRSSQSRVATLIYRDHETSSLLVAANLRNNVARNASTIGNLEEALAQLKYYDPTAPGALVTADGATGTYQKEFLFKKTYAQLTLRNNYQVPVQVEVWLCNCKRDTSIGPVTAWSNSYTDMSNVADTDISANPEDGNQFQDLWSVGKKKKAVLEPGQELVSAYWAPRPFYYDPSLSDTHSQTFQEDYYGASWIVSIKGVVAHDSSAAQYGLSPAGVDIILKREYVVEYDGGARFTYVYCTNDASSFSNGAVVSNKPVADNQSYSVS